MISLPVPGLHFSEGLKEAAISPGGTVRAQDRQSFSESQHTREQTLLTLLRDYRVLSHGPRRQCIELGQNADLLRWAMLK